MIVKEWLEDIKERFVKYQTDYNLNGEDVEYLIQQAERVEELETKLSINTNNMKQLQKENECYKQRVEELEEREKIYKEIIQSYGKIADGFVDDIERLVKRNEHYKQALEFYAERHNYQWEVSYRPQQEIDCMVIDDNGHTARKALESEE